MPPAPFWKAYDILMHNAFVTPSQKLSLIVLTSNWPKIFNPTNKILAAYTAQSIRTIQYNLKASSTGATNLLQQGLQGRRPLIKRNYIHCSKPGHPYTVRWFLTLSFPANPNLLLQWATVPKTLLANKSLSPAQKLYLIEFRRFNPSPYPYTLRVLAKAIGIPFSYAKRIRNSLI